MNSESASTVATMALVESKPTKCIKFIGSFMSQRDAAVVAICAPQSNITLVDPAVVLVRSEVKVRGTTAAHHLQLARHRAHTWRILALLRLACSAGSDAGRPPSESIEASDVTSIKFEGPPKASIDTMDGLGTRDIMLAPLMEGTLLARIPWCFLPPGEFGAGDPGGAPVVTGVHCLDKPGGIRTSGEFDSLGPFLGLVDLALRNAKLKRQLDLERP
eukprot:1438788-Prymnesium_polylepis.1